ncbi:hypothetical protein JCM6882_007922 [Rhodosporidiobolus microsporus]
MRVLWALLVPGALAASTILAPEVPSIAFFWSTADDTNRQIPSCAGFQVLTTPNPNVGFNATLPLFFTAAAVGYEPYTVQVDADVGEWFTWSAAFPLGAKITFAMTDSANHSGGAVDGYTVIPGFNNCTTNEEIDASDNPAEITFDTYPDDRPCGEIDLVVSESSAAGPYTVSLLSGSGAYANWTDVDDKDIRLKNFVPAGQNYHLFITNKNGSASAVSAGKTSQLNIAGCNYPDRPSTGSSTPVGAIVGGVIGGCVAAIIIALLAWWFVRRRNKRRAEEYQRQGSGAVTSEFRTADGHAPLVEPFNVPVTVATGGATAAAAAAGMGRGDGYDDSPTSGDGSYDKSLHYATPSPVDGSYHGGPPPHPPPIHPHYQQRHPSAASSTLAPVSPLYDPYIASVAAAASGGDPHSPSSPSGGVPAGYGSYESARSAGSGLAAHGSYDPSSSLQHSVAPSPTEPHPSSLVVNPPHTHSHPHSHPHAHSASHAAQIPPPGAAAGSLGEGADGLANPEEFTYRLFDPAQGPGGGGGGAGASWPPGAGRY